MRQLVISSTNQLHVLSRDAPRRKGSAIVRTQESITCSFCKWRSCEANATVPGIEDGVETLKEGVAVDKVKALSGRIANVVDDEVYAICRAADEGVERARPDLCVRSELERRAAGREEERLEVGVLRGRDAEQTSGGVDDGARCSRVPFECVYVQVCFNYVIDLYSHMRIRQTSRTASDEDEGCSCIDDARSDPEDGGRSAVMNGLVDAPEIARRKSLGERTLPVPCHGKHIESYCKPNCCGHIRERDTSSKF
jgi:hypothetical protein